MATRIYCNDEGDFPSELSVFESSGAIITKGGYRSYMYCPGEGAWRDDPDLVIGFEREAWSPMVFRMWPEFGRVTLFGDGHVDVLGNGAFTAAMEANAKRRLELGWPVCDNAE